MASPSMTPPGPRDARDNETRMDGGSNDGTALLWLRRELGETSLPPRRARLFEQIASIEERQGDLKGATRDYEAAAAGDLPFREPIEGLLRILERSQLLDELANHIDAFARIAHDPPEKVRALLKRALLLKELYNDYAGAKELALEATRAGASPADTAAAWLWVELFACKSGDAFAREQALLQRARLTDDPTWATLLVLDAARTAASQGKVVEALHELQDAGSRSAAAAYLAARTTELLFVEGLIPNTEGMSEFSSTSTYGPVLLSALEILARASALAFEDPATGLANQIPRWAATPERVVDLWIRITGITTISDNPGRATKSLEEVERALPYLTPTDQSTIESLVFSDRVRIAERIGDSAAAIEFIARAFERDPTGPFSSTWAVRLAEQSARTGNPTHALELVSYTLSREPMCVPALSIQWDLLAGKDWGGLANQLESFAPSLEEDPARARTYALAAFTWGALAGDLKRSRAALTQAQMNNLSPEISWRLASLVTTVQGDAVGYDDASRRLITEGAAPDEVLSLQIERLARRIELLKAGPSDIQRAREDVEAAPGGVWLGATLGAFVRAFQESAEVISEITSDQPRACIEALSRLEVDPQRARALLTISAFRAERSGDHAVAKARLNDLLQSDPSDTLSATYLAEIERQNGNHGDAATALSTAAGATRDPELAATLYLEAGWDRWRHNDRLGAVAEFERARVYAPEAAGVVLAWAGWGLPDATRDTRRRVLERAARAGIHPAVLALEDVANEMGIGGEPSRIISALSVLDQQVDRDLKAAGSLATLAWMEGTEANQAVILAACEQIATMGPRGAEIAATEKWRQAHKSGRENALEAAREWFEAGGGLAAAIEWLALSINLNLPKDEQRARLACATGFANESAEAMLAGATIHHLLHRDEGETITVVPGSSAAARLANLEINPPGSPPHRRARALSEIDDVLGEEAKTFATALSGWSLLATGQTMAAFQAFEHVVEVFPSDLSAWEGMRSAAMDLGYGARQAVAAAALGERCVDPLRSGRFWEEAGVLWLSLGEEGRGEQALEASVARDPSRPVAFDLLFRRVRARKEGKRLLELIARRLDHTDDSAELTKLFWEQGRVLREQGNIEEALRSLESVITFDPDHMGALALFGEIFITQERFEEGAAQFARLSSLEEAPPKTRIAAGITAADLYENKLGRYDDALAVLWDLHRANLMTLALRERLVRAARHGGDEAGAVGVTGEVLAILRANPRDLLAAQSLGRIANELRDPSLAHVALSVGLAFGQTTPAQVQAYREHMVRLPHVPQPQPGDGVIAQLGAMGDEGPVAQLFAILGPTLVEAFGPTLQSCGVVKRDRVNSRTTSVLFVEIMAWATAFGLSDLELYIGGHDVKGVQGVPGDEPALVVGAQVIELDPPACTRLARELFAMARGTTLLRHRNLKVIQSIVDIACKVGGLPTDAIVDVTLEKPFMKALSRRTKKDVVQWCQSIRKPSFAVSTWRDRALASHDRVAALASGDIATTLDDMRREPGHDRSTEPAREEELLRFVMDPSYLALRHALGLSRGQ